MVWSARQNVIRNIGGEVNCTLSTIVIKVAMGNISGKKREGNMPLSEMPRAMYRASGDP